MSTGIDIISTLFSPPPISFMFPPTPDSLSQTPNHFFIIVIDNKYVRDR